MSFKANKFMLAFVVLVASGCSQPQGSKFVGHWVALNPELKSFIDIQEEGGIYHFDHSYNAMWKGKDDMDVERMEGKAISDNVLRLGGGLASIDVRLEENKIYLYGDGYSKSK